MFWFCKQCFYWSGSRLWSSASIQNRRETTHDPWPLTMLAPLPVVRCEIKGSFSTWLSYLAIFAVLHSAPLSSGLRLQRSDVHGYTLSYTPRKIRVRIYVGELNLQPPGIDVQSQVLTKEEVWDWKCIPRKTSGKSPYGFATSIVIKAKSQNILSRFVIFRLFLYYSSKELNLAERVYYEIRVRPYKDSVEGKFSPIVLAYPPSGGSYCSIAWLPIFAVSLVAVG